MSYAKEGSLVMKTKFKIVNIFIIFGFIIPFTASMYINIASAFADTSTPSTLPEASPTATVKGAVDVGYIHEPSKRTDGVISVTDKETAVDSTYVPERLYDKETSVNVYDKGSGRIMQMNLHDYVICAVAGEMPATFELEALKAQAVAARTFTVSHLRSACSSNGSAHVCTYFGCCQAFVSVERMKQNWGAQFEEKYAKISAAVEQTDSLVMLYNGSPITVFYFSTSNGYTDACQDVFTRNLPYYKSVESPGEETASGYYSYVKLGTREFVDTLYSKLGISISENELMTATEITRTDGGRVRSISFNGQSVKGTQIRTAFQLRSADFHLTFSDDHVLIEVYGYGHGVGMSQLGANYMAKQGSSFFEILKHYYIGVDITNGSV